MTKLEKVIKALEYCKDNQYVNDCDKCDYGGKTGMFCIRMIDDALALLKEQEEKMKHLNNITLEYEKEVFRLQTLLKEQEAEKPIAKEDDTYECCICGAIVGQDELDASGIVQARFNYCQNCGQAVKWE